MSFLSASCCDVHLITVMPAHSASEDARKRAYVAGIHVFRAAQHQRRGWDKPGHDDVATYIVHFSLDYISQLY